MSLYLKKFGKFRVKRLDCLSKRQKRLIKMGFGKNSELEVINSRSSDNFMHIKIDKDIIMLPKHMARCIFVERVE